MGFDQRQSGNGFYWLLSDIPQWINNHGPLRKKLNEPKNNWIHTIIH